jgi:hypothetical protein
MSRYNELDYQIFYYKNRKQKQHNMRSWKTTVSGVLIAVGTWLTNNEDGNLKVIGQVLTFVGTVLLGFMAKDYNVSGK